jgi:RimJ/RimL family protein N-acetyltransferase
MLYNDFLKGKNIYSIKTKNGEKVNFRAPRKSDLDSITSYINNLVEEEAMILVNKKVSKENERTYLNRMIKRNKNKEDIFLCAECQGKIIGIASIGKGRYREKHVGSLGIGVSMKYRHSGIGRAFIKLLLDMSKNLKLNLITLEVFKKNLNAIGLYKKMGFKKVGEIPQKIYYKGKYENVLIMYREL